MALTDVDESPHDSPPRRAKNRPKSRRRLRWVLGFVAFGLVLLLFVLNGPGFRSIGRLTVKKLAATQGLEGDLTLSGTLWSGFSITEAHFRATDPTETDADASPLQILRADIGEAKLSYRAFSLIRNPTELNWLDLVKIDRVTVDVRLPDSAKGTGSAKPEKQPTNPKTDASEFNPLWNLFATDISITGIDIAVERSGARYELKNFALVSPSGKNGELRFDQITLPDQPTLDGITVPILKGVHALGLGALSLGGSSEIRELAIGEPAPGVLTAKVSANLGGGSLTAALAESGTVTLALRQGTSISLPDIVAAQEPPPPLEGRVTALNFRFENPFQPPSEWILNGSLVGSRVGWDGASIDSLALLVRDNTLTLEAKRPDASAYLEVSIPLDQAITTEALNDLPIDIVARAEIPKLGTLVESLVGSLPLDGAVSLETQNVQIDTRGNLRSGSLLLQAENLSWDGLTLAVCELAANVEKPNQIQIAVDTAIDQLTRLRLTGNVDTRLMSYSAESALTLNPQEILASWMNTKGLASIQGTTTLNWSGSGEFKPHPDKQKHEGLVSLDLNSLQFNEGRPLNGELKLSYENQSAKIAPLRIESGDLSLTGSGSWDGKMIALTDWKLSNSSGTPLSLNLQLPFSAASDTEFLEQTGDLFLELKISDFDVAEIEAIGTADPSITGILNGDLSGSGQFGNVHLGGTFSFLPEFESTGDQSKVNLDLAFDGSLSSPESWDTRLDAEVIGLVWNDLDIGSIDLEIQTETGTDGKELAGKLAFDQSGASIRANASIGLDGASSFPDLADRPISANADIDAKDLAQLWHDFAPGNLKSFPLEGSLHLVADQIHINGKHLEGGNLELSSDALKLDGEPISDLAITAEVSSPDVVDGVIQIEADDLSSIEAHGNFHLVDQIYSGEATVVLDLKSEGALKRLLGGRHIATMLPGHTSLALKGNGDLKEGAFHGTIDLDASDLRLANGAAPITAAVDAEFSEASLSSTLSMSSDPLNFSGALNWENNRLELSDWTGVASGRNVIEASGSLPLDLEKLTPSDWFAADAPIDLSLKIDSLPLSTVFQLIADKPALLGNFKADLTVGGSPSELDLGTSLALTDISVPGNDPLEVGALSIEINTANGEANLSGAFQHPNINPLNLKATLPFNPGEWVSGKSIFMDEPVVASARMEKSSLAFLSSQIPGIKSVVGSIAIDAAVAGSLAKPTITGNGALDVSRLRLDNRNAPSFYNIDLVTRFSDNRLSIDRLNAVIAGGDLNGKGSISLNPGEEPNLDFRVSGADILIARTHDLSLRSSLNLSLSGPMSRARLTGEVGIANSRFFKNFDLMPLAMPARSTSVLPAVEKSPTGGSAAYTDLNIGVDIPPFKNWPIDVRIFTQDPFLVRSNLVESALVADLKINGTLGQPFPVGFLEIAEGELSLPFSSIDVEIGRVTFDQNTGFNGALEVRARAKANDYRINVFLFNQIFAPQFVLTSVPPLPSEDLLTLLITGTTRQDLVGAGAGSMAASKAAALMFKNMRKAKDRAERDPSLLDKLQERTELEIGGVNPETGEHTIAGKVRLWKQLFFVGDVDAQNDYRAVLKYVFRYR